jgi:hypothetical protein
VPRKPDIGMDRSDSRQSLLVFSILQLDDSGKELCLAMIIFAATYFNRESHLKLWDL